MKERESLKEKWSTFGGIILSPGSAISLLITGASLYYSYKATGTLSISLSIFASIIATIAGYFINGDLERMRGTSLLEKKGRSAMRNLESINRQIVKIKSYIKEFLESNKKRDIDDIREIDRHLSMVEFNIQAGLEDWIDVVPELEIFSQLKLKEQKFQEIKEKVASEKSIPTIPPSVTLPSSSGKISVPQLDNEIRSLLNQIVDLQNELMSLSKPNK